jgi:hypothetical protein
MAKDSDGITTEIITDVSMESKRALDALIIQYIMDIPLKKYSELQEQEVTYPVAFWSGQEGAFVLMRGPNDNIRFSPSTNIVAAHIALDKIRAKFPAISLVALPDGTWGCGIGTTYPDEKYTTDKFFSVGATKELAIVFALLKIISNPLMEIPTELRP